MLYDLIFSPYRGFSRVQREAPWKLMYAVAALAFINRFLSIFDSAAGYGFAVAPGLLGTGAAACALWFLFFWMLAAGLIHLFAGFWKEEGTAVSLFLLLGFSSMPYMFLFPVGLFFKSGILTGAPLEYALAGLLNFWVFILVVMAVKLNYECSTEKAMLIILTPVFFVFIAVLIIAAMALSGVLISIG